MSIHPNTPIHPPSTPCDNNTQWAYAVARGAYALAGLGNDSITLKYFDLAFARQDEVRQWAC